MLPSRLGCIDAARGWAAGHARAAGVGDDDVADLELALTEAFSNIVRHSYDGDPDHVVGLALVITDTRVELSMRDTGHAFDQATYRPPDLDEPGAGGYGVQLIADVMDEVSRTPLAGGGTLLRMTKMLRGARHG